MLAERMSKHNVNCWLVNTGWTGGKFGTPNGKRCPLEFTRRIVDAIHSGELASADTEYEKFGVFNLSIPTSIKPNEAGVGVTREILNPEVAWADKEAFGREVRKLGGMFSKAFKLYEPDVAEPVRKAGPVL